MHEFYSPIDEEIDDFLTWLGPRAASGTVVKTVRDVMLPAGPQPPVAEAGPEQTVALGSGVTLDGSGSRDPNGDALTYQWTQTGGPSVTLSSATTARPTFTAPATASTLTFRLTVGDGEFTASDTVTVNVAAESGGGTPPTVPARPRGTTPGPRRRPWRSPPGHNRRRRRRHRGDVGQPGSPCHRPGRVHPQGDLHRRRRHRPGLLEAADGSRDRHLPVLLERRPVVLGPRPGGLRAATIGDPVEAIDHAWQRIGHRVLHHNGLHRSTPLLAWIGRNDEPASGHTPPTGFTEAQRQGLHHLGLPSAGRRWHPRRERRRLLRLRGTLHSVLVAVKGGVAPPVNQPPVAEAGPAQSVSTGAVVTLDGSGSSDPDGDALTFGWAQTAGPAVTLSSASVARPTFTAPGTASSLTFALTVGDGQATATDSVTVTVTAPPPVNRPPVAEAGPAQSVSTGAVVTLDGSGSSDPDGDALTFAWVQTAGPAVTLSSASVASPTFTAPGAASSLTFRLTVGDGQATATDTVTVTVTAPRR